ncbi:MAG: aldo/keto reductase [candidate division Zixibacteria bacterium]|nr:aldo/keto reductase [Gammaproteobacteria bacterium]NIX56605.1 aldo/keto reductase [candidate division Zixibacteria bacterium]
MKYRVHNHVKISEIGWGGYALSGVYGKKNLDQFENVIRRAYDLGVNFFDVADSYGPAEKILGKAVSPFRKKIIISTKVGWNTEGKPDSSFSHVVASCEKSLEHLGTDYIDLYQIHFDDHQTPVEETVSAFERLKTEGKIRHYGVGHIQAAKMAEYFRTGEIFSAMMELSAVARQAYLNNRSLCIRKGVAIIGFSVTGRGLLTGDITPQHSFAENDIRQIDPLFQRERFASGLRTAQQFKMLGQKYGKSSVQVAIAWVLAQTGVVCALTGPSTIPHLEENIDTSGWSLPSDDLERLNIFLNDEEQRLERAQKQSLHDILERDLDAKNAFKDLLYVFETLIEHGWVKEKDIMPLFLKFFALRGQEGPKIDERMKEIQKDLQDSLPI